jgi:hypothetical protein
VEFGPLRHNVVRVPQINPYYFMHFEECAEPSAQVAALFNRHFGANPPAFGHHFVAMVQADAAIGSDAPRVLAYTHLWTHYGAMLSGGSCVDGARLQSLPAEHRHQLNQHGSIWRHLAAFAFRKYALSCEAFFGHCGDRRAYQVCTEIGFEPTEHPHLIALWHRPLTETRRAELVTAIHALGPF